MTLTPSPSFSDSPTPSPPATQTPSPSPTRSATPLPPVILAASPTWTPTVTATTVLGAYYSLRVYNSAGELLRVLADQVPLPASSFDFQVLTPSFIPSIGQNASLLVSGQSLSWDGKSGAGALLKSGSYWIQYDQIDAFGNVGTLSKAVSIIETAGYFQVRVFNSAGEEVRELAAKQAISGAVPSHLKADRATVDSSAGGAVTFDLGPGSLSWDGTGNGGQRLANGSYLVQLSVVSSGGASWNSSVQVTLLNAAASPLGLLQIGPNPWRGEPGQDLVIQAGAGLAELNARLFNLAGELAAGASAKGGSLMLRAPRGGLASGVYLLVLNGQDLSGNRERKTLKIYVFH